LIEFGVFYNKSKILTILFIVKYEKITHFDELLVLLGPIISRFFACSNEEKQKTKGAFYSPISMMACIFKAAKQNCLTYSSKLSPSNF
jgi:hypothetical protein